MKKNDESLFYKKQELQNKRSRLSYLQSHLPAEFETDRKGHTTTTQAYIDAINAINALASEINTLITVITELVATLDDIKLSSDSNITKISNLGNEGISIPGYTMERDNLAKDLIPLDMANYPYIDVMSGIGTPGTIESLTIDRVDCKMYIPNGYKVTPLTKLTVFFTGSDGKEAYFDNISNQDQSSNANSLPEGPVLIVNTDSFRIGKQPTFTKGNDDRIDSIISQAKSKLNITNSKISIVAYSEGNELFAKYITKYSANVDKAVMINPASFALGKLTESSSSYSNIKEVQIIQATGEEKDRIADVQEFMNRSSNTNTTFSRFIGEHGDSEKVLSNNYDMPQATNGDIIKNTESTDTFVNPNYNIWEHIQ